MADRHEIDPSAIAMAADGRAGDAARLDPTGAADTGRPETAGRGDTPGLGAARRDDVAGLGAASAGDALGFGTAPAGYSLALGAAGQGDAPGLGAARRDDVAGLGAARGDDAGRLAVLRRRLPLWLGVGALVALGVGLLGDAPKVGSALLGFEWPLLVPILGLTFLNYLIRFGKWSYYLRLIGAPHVPVRDSLLIFLSGLAMTMTPGKLGEWLKSYLLRQRHGVGFSVSAPIILAERLTDGVAMLLLALGGLMAYGYGGELLGLIALGAVGFVLLTQVRAVPEAILVLLGRLPVARDRVDHARLFFLSANRLFRPLPFLLSVAMGLVSWGGECVAFYFVLVGLGIPPSADVLLQAAFVLAISSLVGSVSMLPGGLAVAEGSIAGLLLLLGLTDQPAVAAAATLLIRVCTLWFGVAVGVVALFGLDRVGSPATSQHLAQET